MLKSVHFIFDNLWYFQAKLLEAQLAAANWKPEETDKKIHQLEADLYTKEKVILALHEQIEEIVRIVYIFFNGWCNGQCPKIFLVFFSPSIDYRWVDDVSTPSNVTAFKMRFEKMQMYYFNSLIYIINICQN